MFPLVDGTDYQESLDLVILFDLLNHLERHLTDQNLLKTSENS